MKVNQHSIEIRTNEGQQFLDITESIEALVLRSEVQNGMLLINSLHATTALFINEFQPALLDDMASILQALIPRRAGYRHDDRRYSDCDRANAHAHLRATLLGRPIALGVAGGGILLGQYQSVILAELDGPRQRRLHIQIVGE